MSDTISEIKNGALPAYIQFEHGAAWARNGATWFEWYDAAEAPAVKPSGYGSRFEVPTAVNMPMHRAAGIALCDRLELLLPALSDVDALRLSYEARRITSGMDSDSECSSLIVSGWRYGQVYKIEQLARKMTGTRPMKVAAS